MIALPAHLTLREARAALASLTPEITASTEPVIEVDAAALTHIDSATLAVLLACLRKAEAQQRRLVVLHAPARLVELATLYGVQDLLGLQTH